MSRIKVVLLIALCLFLITSGVLASTVTQISTGFSHTVALKDGAVWTWGSNSDGQLGDGTTVYNRSTPVQLKGLTGVIAVSSGGGHTVALKDDGTVWSWGYNIRGQLGDGTRTQRSTPVQITGLTGVVAVSAGQLHTVALKNDGTVWSWGYNNFGQLGDGTTTQRLTPVQVSDLTGVAAISTGCWYTVALKNDGTVWTWGSNSYGQLGDGTTTQRTTPVQVSDLTGVAAISAGDYHTVALKNDGTVWDWGRNNYGQLGDGTTADRSTPVQVTGLTGVAAVDAGSNHTVALKNDGVVWACGYNNCGQLGDGTATNRSTPVQVAGLTGVTAISAGSSHTAAVKDDGTVWAWGYNSSGQLGDGTTTQRLAPVQVTFDSTPPTGTVVINSNAAYTNSPVVTLGISATDNSGTVSDMMISNDGVFDTEMWTAYSTSIPRGLSSPDGVKTVYVKFRDKAYNESDVTSDTIVLDTTPPEVFTPVASPSGWTEGDVSVTFSTTDVLSGVNHYEVSLDYGAFVTAVSPYVMSTEGIHNVQVKAVDNAGNSRISSVHTYITRTPPAVHISRPYGNGRQISYMVSYERAVEISLTASDVTLNKTGTADGAVSVSITGDETGLVTISDISGEGTLGISIAAGTASDAFDRLAPAVGPSATFKTGTGIVAVSGGMSHTVALKNDGTVWAWGWNKYGQLGDGTTTDRLTPVQVTGLTGVAAISGGDRHTVAVKADGTVWTWGDNSGGQIGDGTKTQRLTPVQVTGLTGVVAVSAGSTHTVALKNDGTVWTWGNNSYGQLGDGTKNTQKLTPVQVSGVTGVVAISANGYYTVALKNDGTVWTWGYGPSGDGTTTSSLSPINVSGLTGVAAISGGYWHTVALKDDGTVWTWGYNGYGQIGDGTTTDRLAPVQVPGLTGVSAISAGYYHTVASKNDETVWAWGYNKYGQVGNGTSTDGLTPVQVTGLTGVVAVDAGDFHTVALKSDGTVWTWGENFYGQLGDGTTTHRSTPVQVVFDWTAPTGSIVINSGASYTNSISVTLAISATDNNGSVSQMKISNDGIFDTEPWETYSTTKSWTLTAGNGVKTVSIKFKDAAGNESDVMTDTIVLDTTASLRVTITPAEAVTAGAQWRQVGTVQWRNSGDIENSVAEGSYQIEFKNISGWGTPATVVAYIKGGEIKEITAVYAGAVSIAKAKGSADGTLVYIDRAIVSAAYEGFFYIESDKRESGIRVEMPGHALSAGMRANISGTMSTNSNGERYILATTAVQSAPPNNTGSVIPLGITNKTLGGGRFGLQQGVRDWQMVLNSTTGKYERVWGESKGLNNIGLLVKCWGKVIRTDTDIFIGDGSETPVKLVLPAGVSIDESWQYISVTGISSCEKVDNELHRVLLVRPGEVITHN